MKVRWKARSEGLPVRGVYTPYTRAFKPENNRRGCSISRNIHSGAMQLGRAIDAENIEKEIGDLCK